MRLHFLMRSLQYLLISSVAAVLACVQHTTSCLGQEAAVKLIDRYPFDRITLNAENDNATIDVQLLDFPNRQVPSPLPTSGSLEVRRLKDPTVRYSVQWSAIARVELFEHLVLAEAINYTSTGKLDLAYEDLEFLHANYPQLDGLQEATEEYLQKDALASYSEKQYDESLAILGALYDVNPQRRGLARAVEGVSDRLLQEQLERRDFAAARQILDALRTSFPQLQLASLERWQKRIQQDAEQQLESARAAIAAGDYAAARKAVRQALMVLPNVTGARELFAEIDRLAPQTAVGVSRHPRIVSGDRLEWAQQRVSRLTKPHFCELVGVGSEGGDYDCPWAHIESDDTGLQLSIVLKEAAFKIGITPERVALELLDRANPNSTGYRADFGGVFKHVEVVDGQGVTITWKHPFVAPLALLQIQLAELSSQAEVPGTYVPQEDDQESSLRVFQLQGDRETGPRTIVEKTFESDEAALSALSQGDIEVLADVAPWQYDQLAQIASVTVSAYRVPTVHVLLLNYNQPLVQRREFRRALCYGIDRQRIVAEVLVGKGGRPGFRVLSGPMPAGITIGDTIGYAYRQDLQALPYEPRLAAVLYSTARSAVTKLQRSDEADAKAAGTDGEAADGDGQPQDLAPEPPEPLILIHPDDSVSRTLCQVIKRQLDPMGIPVELRQESRGAEGDQPWDLRYAELCMAEPLIDVRRLLGPAGLAGHCSPTMNLALRRLDQASNWNDVRERLHEIHEIAAEDLPVIPLWQTVEYFAHQKTLRGIGHAPVSLYQDVARWGHSFQQVGRKP